MSPESKVFHFEYDQSLNFIMRRKSIMLFIEVQDTFFDCDCFIQRVSKSSDTDFLTFNCYTVFRIASVKCDVFDAGRKIVRIRFCSSISGLEKTVVTIFRKASLTYLTSIYKLPIVKLSMISMYSIASTADNVDRIVFSTRFDSLFEIVRLISTFGKL